MSTTDPSQSLDTCNGKAKLLNTSGPHVPVQLSYRCAPNFFLSSKKTSVPRQCIRPGTHRDRLWQLLTPTLTTSTQAEVTPASSHLKVSPAPSSGSRKDSSQTRLCRVRPTKGPQIPAGPQLPSDICSQLPNINSFAWRGWSRRQLHQLLCPMARRGCGTGGRWREAGGPLQRTLLTEILLKLGISHLDSIS